MATAEQPTSLAVKVLAVLAVLAVVVASVVRAALAELGVRVVSAVRAALAELVVPVAPVVRAVLVELVGREALAGLGVRVAPAALVVQEALAGLELVQVAVPVLAHRHAQVAARPRTKSVTVAHHRGPAPVLAAEDLAAVAETMRGPAAAEAVVAWEAAG